MWTLKPLKLTFWLLLIGGFLFAAYRNKEDITYKFREVYARMKRGLGGSISLNDSFADDLESGLSSRNFDIISQNDEDARLGLDSISKKEIKRIMEIDNVSFDKARLLYTERKFGKNGIAPDGTPMDPKAVTFGK